MAIDERTRLLDAAVGDDDLARAARQQRAERAGRAAAGADEKDASATQVDAGVALDVAHEAGAVGVVAEPAVGVEAQRVARGRDPRSRRRLRDLLERFELERHRHVAAARAAGGERAYGSGEAVERAEQPFVDDRLSGLRREGGMDERRLAVRDRMTDDGIAADGGAHLRLHGDAHAWPGGFLNAR